MPHWELKEHITPFTIGAWVIDADWAHPIWSQYALFLIHLRDVPGFKSAEKIQPHATHEVSLWALAPDLPIKEGEGLKPKSILMPPNFVGQFESASDESAIEYIQKVIGLIDERKVSPDTDFRRQWKVLFPFHQYE